ncbi:MAG TPA: hypothetical protein PKD85_09615 [Saprospiraceae bacterium]|nr:hypothetical protein [Saprospiraceae bacterium]
MPIRSTYEPSSGDRSFGVPLIYIPGVFCDSLNYRYGRLFSSQEWITKCISVVDIPLVFPGSFKMIVTTYSDSTPNLIEIESVNCKFSLTLDSESHLINHLCE